MSESALVDAVFGTFDEECGGFGIAPKFPLPAPIRLALHLHATTDDSRAAANRLVVARCDRGGGRSRRSRRRILSLRRRAQLGSYPHREKLLEVNAALLRLYVEAATILESERYADRAHDALTYVQNWLADQVDGGWGGSQRATTAGLR